MGSFIKKLLAKHKSEYNSALENEDVNKLNQIIDELLRRYKNAKVDCKKELGKQCLDIFNVKNTQGKTAVMIAAEQGHADILKKWYRTPYQFIRDVLFEKDELDKIYKQENYSYTTQDKEGRNALMLACKSQNPDCIEYILSPETKKMLNQRDINNKTPIEYAINYDVYKKNYNTIDEFMRVFNRVISKKSKYFPNECFRLDEKYVEVAHKIEDEDIKDDILNAYKQTNASNTKKAKQKQDISKIGNDEVLGYNACSEVSNNKVLQKRSRDFSDELEGLSNQRLKTNGTTTAKTSKLLETHPSTYKPKERKYFTKAFTKSKASPIKSEQTQNVISQDIDTSKVLANHPWKNSYKPESNEYNKRVLDKLKTFIDKINISSTDCATQTALLYECRELFCLPKHSFPEEGIQFLSLVDDSNVRIEMIDIILGYSNEYNH